MQSRNMHCINAALTRDSRGHTAFRSTQAGCIGIGFFGGICSWFNRGNFSRKESIHDSTLRPDLLLAMLMTTLS